MKANEPNGLLLRSKLGRNLDVVAELSFDLHNLLRNILSRLSQKVVGGCLSETGSTKVVDNNFSIGSKHFASVLLHSVIKEISNEVRI